MRSRGLHRLGERNSLDPRITSSQQFVRTIFDPMSHVGISRAAIGRVVFEAAILGRIVRRRDNNAVSQVFLASAVVNQNGP